MKNLHNSFKDLKSDLRTTVFHEGATVAWNIWLLVSDKVSTKLN